MANWYGLSRTNYFKVKDTAAFIEAMSKFSELSVNEEENGFCLCAEGDGYWPTAIFDAEGNDIEELDFIEYVRPHLAEGQVAIFATAGHEKARYVTGHAFAIMNDERGSTLDINIDDIYHMVHGTWGIEPTRAEY